MKKMVQVEAEFFLESCGYRFSTIRKEFLVPREEFEKYPSVEAFLTAKEGAPFTMHPIIVTYLEMPGDE